MKVKLLKKIRKRFEIVRIDELASNAPHILKYFKSDHGLPFFYVMDNDLFDIMDDCEDLRWREKGFKNVNDAKDYILKRILYKHSEQFRHKDGKQTKVWWVK
jgi:hypothetical protein